MRRSRKEIRKRRKAAGKGRFYRILAVVLVVAGLGVLGYSGFQWLMVRYNQAQLRSDYEASAGFRHLMAEEEEVEEPEVIEITSWKPMELIIPAIDVALMCVGDGDVFDHALLDKGPTHFQMSDLPSTKGGNVAFAGHRAGRWNFFLDIDQLGVGDEIFLDVEGYRFIYLVEWVKVLDKYDWGPVDDPTDYPVITLQTCEPKHVVNPDYRLWVRGALGEVVPIPTDEEVETAAEES